MFQSWRLKLRQAEEAYRGGRLDEAGRILNESPLREFRPAKKLLAKVAQRLVERGQGEVNLGESLAGWRDLEKAEAMGAATEVLTPLRQELLERVIREAVDHLEADDPEAAIARLDGLAGHDALSGRGRRIRQAAVKIKSVKRLARQGRFADAERQLTSAAASCPDESFIATLRQRLSSQAEQYRSLSQRLHEQLTKGTWNPVLATAQELIALAPDDAPAQDALRRAWAAVGTELRDHGCHSAEAQPVCADEHAYSVATQSGALAMQEIDKKAVPVHGPRGRRFVLWVDAVGGYLVCCGNEVTIGQPVPGGPVDVPILGDISTVHARICRDGEGYLIEPFRKTRLAGKPLTGVAPLVDGDLIDMGSGVQMRFRRPHALSATARLEFVSGHRTQPSVDAVLLMAESCVLGPGGGSHVVCPDWSRDVVLYGRDGALSIRSQGKFEIDGCEHEGQAQIEDGSHVTGEDFSLSLEEV